MNTGDLALASSVVGLEVKLKMTDSLTKSPRTRRSATRHEAPGRGGVYKAGAEPLEGHAGRTVLLCR